MENFNADLQNKHNNLKKRKLIKELHREKDSEKKFCQLVSATEDLFEQEGRKTDHLYQKLLFCQDKLNEKELHVLEQTRKMKDLSIEGMRLQSLLSEKNEATTNIEMTKEPPKAIIPEEVNASQEEPVNHSCCRSISNADGDRIVGDAISSVLRTLIESVLGMRVSFGQQSADIIHVKSGYAFSLTWSRDGHELVYRVSSLGTLENIALKWMKEEILFTTNMCPIFFERICVVIGRV